MKKLLILSLLVLMIIFTACNKTPEVEPIGFTYGDIDFTNDEEFFDLERTSMPSEDQIHSIKKGMSMKDIIYILGRPHNEGPYMVEAMAYDWYTESGAICRVSIQDKGIKQFRESTYKTAKVAKVEIIPPLSETDITTLGVLWNGEDISPKEFFDREEANTPTYEQISQITVGMTIQDVISIIGKPRNFGQYSFTRTYVWYTENGKFEVTVNIDKNYNNTEEINYDNYMTADYYGGFVSAIDYYPVSE